MFKRPSTPVLKRCLIVSILITCCILLRLMIFNNVEDQSYLLVISTKTNQSLQQRSNNNIGNNNNTKNGTVKTILYWTSMFRQIDFYLGLGKDIFKNCPYTNCYATNYKTHMPVNQYDAIIFHGAEYNRYHFGEPTKRKSNQVYIFANLESPVNTPDIIKDSNRFYNWTMTYRSDSDIVRKYGLIENRTTTEQNNYQLPSVESIKKRPKMIAWFVSHCRTSSRRDKLYAHLNDLIPVDVYGKCGKLKCPRTNSNGCYELIEKQYKFYLAFENSICIDYVTEKLYNILKLNIVPIVYGGANYDQIAPPHSVIDATKFRSVAELAKYLTFLNDNPLEYLKYFEWKKDYVVGKRDYACILCEKLNQPLVKKVYDNMYEWWKGVENNNVCRTGNKLPEIVQT